MTEEPQTPDDTQLDASPRWADLAPSEAILSALDHAGPRRALQESEQNIKRAWSERFANSCAVAVANELRTLGLSRYDIRPVSLQEGTEPLTPLGQVDQKRIDVTVTHELLGLELGFSLKGLNFQDNKAKNFDKNLTGRMYELSDEMRAVHERLPHAFMVGIFFLPLESVDDKKSKDSNSSFANAVIKLRARTGRLDVSLAGQAAKCDAAYVALYADHDCSLARPGVCRFFDVENDPPKRYRPKTSLTLGLREMVHDVLGKVRNEKAMAWSQPEPD